MLQGLGSNFFPFVLSRPIESRFEESRHDSFSRFCNDLDFICLPGKGVSTLLGWSELLPMKGGFLDRIAEQRVIVKTVNSTFALPKFFTKQIEFFRSCSHLKNDFLSGCDQSKIFLDVKKVFYASIGLLIATLKMPLLLDKTNVIDLSQISRKLPDALKKSSTLLTLCLACMNLVESCWAFESFLKHRGSSAFSDNAHSSKAAKVGIKLFSCTVKTALAFLGTAALFFGWHLSPLILAGSATLSFGTSLTSKLVRHGNTYVGAKLRPSSFVEASLPE